MTRRSRVLTGGLALLIAFGSGAPALAGNGVVTRSGTTLRLDFPVTESRDSLLMSASGGSSGSIVMTNNAVGGTLSTSAANCSYNAPTDEVTCQVAFATRLVVEFGAGDDFTDIPMFAVPVTLELHGGDGQDTMWGTEGDDVIDGGPGPDDVLGFAGDDQLQGGAGDDRVAGGIETDDIHGGPGFDLVDYGAQDGPTHISLDDVADDGPASDGDNVHSDIEDVIGTSEADVIVGSAAGNFIFGGIGDDVIDGAGGSDRYLAGDGNDRVTSRDGTPERIDCGDGADTLVADDTDVSDGCETEQRSPELQTDLDGDGAARPVDCDDGNAAIRPGAVDVPDDGIDQDCSGADTVDLDRDRDGSPRPLDCDDTNPRVRPGAREVRGNRIDEDCNGRAEPLAVVTNGVPNAWVTAGSITRNIKLGVRDVRRGMTVELRCGGGGCPFGKRTFKIKRRKRLLDLHPALRDARLAAGTVLELRIKRKGAIGKVVRYSMRAGAAPRSTPLCLPPGARKAREC